MLKRILAYLLDGYLITTIQLIIYSLYNYFVSGEFRLSMLYMITNFRFLFIFIYLFYFFICEFLWKKTLGKKIFKLEVMYEKRDLKSIIIRTISRLIPVDLFAILIYKRTLHDIFSRTNVIEKIDSK